MADYRVNRQPGNILLLPIVSLALGKGNIVCYDTADGALKAGADTATFIYVGMTIESSTTSDTGIRVDTSPAYYEIPYTSGDAAAAKHGEVLFVDGANACDDAAGSAQQVIFGRLMKVISVTVVGVLTKPGNILAIAA